MSIKYNFFHIDKEFDNNNNEYISDEYIFVTYNLKVNAVVETHRLKEFS